MFMSNFDLQIYPGQTPNQHSVSVLLNLGYKHLDVVQSPSINSKYQGHTSWKEKHERD